MVTPEGMIPSHAGGSVTSSGFSSVDEDFVAWMPHTRYAFFYDIKNVYKVIEVMVQDIFHYLLIKLLQRTRNGRSIYNTFDQQICTLQNGII